MYLGEQLTCSASSSYVFNFGEWHHPINYPFTQIINPGLLQYFPYPLTNHQILSNVDILNLCDSSSLISSLTATALLQARNIFGPALSLVTSQISPHCCQTQLSDTLVSSYSSAKIFSEAFCFVIVS